MAHRRAASVTGVALFEPLIATVVVAERLPEPRLVAILDPDAADPLRALPEVPRRHDETCRPAMLGGERLAVVLERDEGLVVQHVGEGQVRRVPAIAEGDPEGRLRIELDGLEERVDAHA